ncbi:helix-turn-helix transcriptional regulator [Solidesulfovibrio carbinolicus]|uniref:helix-turn-helix transcriptional regulator n=1 Tax=Solidesulfovibrio carbinolicus TaxID=296842 RepID=UPI0013ED7D0D|nr:hypothetical protein [Solidesulfovibrio carbinolicus]
MRATTTTTAAIDIDSAAILGTEQLATRIGSTARAVAVAVHRRAFHLVPQPFKVGRRLRWRIEDVDAWIAEQKSAHTIMPAAPAPKRRGRPTKTEARAKAAAKALAEAQAQAQAQANAAAPAGEGA